MEQQQQGESAVAAERALKRRHVHKFGGSSLADPVCYRRVASILEQQAEQDQARIKELQQQIEQVKNIENIIKNRER